MILDAHNLFSDAQEVTQTGTASTNSIDLGPLSGSTANTGRDLGVGEELYVVVQVDTALTGASAAVVVTVETDSDSEFGSATTTQTVGTLAATAAAGSRIVAKLAPAQWNERYVQLKYTESGGTLTGGNVTAYLTKDLQAYTAYQDASLIS